ncbi:MAG TPA: hypothetical protein VD963_07800 [Phycisphaerales bacterium]|nr:hypothetical protein [Phycisphaerales bacterium]
MLMFVVYAVAVWFAACRGRRRWEGFAAVAVGLGGCVAVGYLHYQLNIWTEGRIFLRVLQVLLVPYAILVTLGGLFLAALPRRSTQLVPCRACQYELAGLCGPCPECGARGPVADQPPPPPMIAPTWATAGAW